MSTRPPRVAAADARLRLPATGGGSSAYSAWRLDEAGFLAYLDRCGVRRGVVHAAAPAPSADAASLAAANRTLLAFVERHRGRFTGACAVDLRLVEESLRAMEAWKRASGQVWVAELDFDARDAAFPRAAFDRVLGQAGALGMIVTVHTDLHGIRELGRAHPDANLVFSHLEAGADHPELLGRVEAVGLGRRFHIEVGPRGYERMGLVEFGVEKLGATKLLYASNFATYSPAAVIARIENAFLPLEQKQAILSGNLERLLKEAGWRS